MRWPVDDLLFGVIRPVFFITRGETDIAILSVSPSSMSVCHVGTVSKRLNKSYFFQHMAAQLVQTRAPTRALRSSDAALLVVPRIHTELARRAFSVAAPSTWNSLPADIRLCKNILTFNRHLKTHLFKLT